MCCLWTRYVHIYDWLLYFGSKKKWLGSFSKLIFNSQTLMHYLMYFGLVHIHIYLTRNVWKVTSLIAGVVREVDCLYRVWVRKFHCTCSNPIWFTSLSLTLCFVDFSCFSCSDRSDQERRWIWVFNRILCCLGKYTYWHTLFNYTTQLWALFRGSTADVSLKQVRLRL